jgi:hypothetical protein
VFDPFFAYVESSALSEWITGDLWAFPIILIFHTVGLAFLVGANVVVSARILGVTPGVPLPTLERYFRVAWIGFWLNALSGVLLLIAYPTKALTNPLFYFKLLLIAVAVAMMRSMRRRILEQPDRLRFLAAGLLACWALSIIAGRLLAYTYTRLQVVEFL